MTVSVVWQITTDYANQETSEILTPAWHRKAAVFQTKFKLWTEVWFEVFHYSSDERIIEIITEIKFAIKNLLIHSWEERLTCFDCKVCFGGSKFTSSAEGRKFNWLIYDSMTSLFACGRFSKSRGLSASVSFLPSFPFPFPLFYSLHSSPCNSLLPNCTETLATQATRWPAR